MWSWILTGALYLFGIGFFRFLGGVGSAEKALQRWGETTARKRWQARLNRQAKTG